MLKNIARKLAAFHRDEQGADMVEYILIIAAIALPMVGILYWFRNEISQWAKGIWENIKGGGGTTDPGTLQ